MNKLQRALLISGVLIVLFVAIGLLGRRSSPSRLLQAYKTSLLLRGEKLTYASLTASRAPASGTSLSLFSNAAARLRAASLNTRWLDGRKYVGPGQARALCRENLQSPGATNGTRSSSWDGMATELARIDTPMAEVREALKEAPAQSNLGTNVFSRLPNFIAIRSAAQWLAIATIYELHQGHLDAALQNLEAVAELARLNRDEYTLAAQMIRIAVSGLGVATTWEALQAPGWTEPQLRRMQSVWEQVDLAQALERGMLGSRAQGEELWARIRQPNGGQALATLNTGPLLGGPSMNNKVQTFVSDHIFLPIYKVTVMDDDELLYLKIMQESLGSLRSLNAGAAWVTAHRELDQAFLPVYQMTNYPARLRHPLSSIAIPNLLKALDNGARTETERRLAITAIALERFRLAHGRFPLTLEGLAPEYLSAVPVDLMSGRPLCYHLDPGGRPLLYSVGNDGQDNGGDPRASQTNQVGLWEGRDAVWPTAARAGE